MEMRSRLYMDDSRRGFVLKNDPWVSLVYLPRTDVPEPARECAVLERGLPSLPNPHGKFAEGLAGGLSTVSLSLKTGSIGCTRR